MNLKRIGELAHLNKKNLPSNKEFYDFLMFEIQSHMLEIDDLRDKKDPNVVKEVADIALLSTILALHEGATKETFEERMGKIKSKILENHK